MSYRRALTVLFLLAVATLACNLGSSATSAPPGATATGAVASKTPANFHNGGVTPEAPTDVPTDEQAATEPLPTKTPSKSPTKAPTKAPKPTATSAPDVSTPDTSGSSTCASFQANGDVFWYTIDSKNNTQQVTSYPASATSIDAAFNYDCNPTAFQMVSVWTLAGKQVLTTKNNVDASDTAQVFSDGLKNDKGAMPAGEWGVQFFNAKQLVASSKVTVGGGGGTSSGGGDVTMQGTITDKASGKPINGALFIVLQPGITVDQFINTDNAASADVYSSIKTDSTGQFTLPDPVKRGASYSVLAYAKGYKIAFKDAYAVDDSTANPDVWDIGLSK